MADSIPSKFFLLGKRLLTIICKNPNGLRPVLGFALSEAENHLDKARDISRLPKVALSEIVDNINQPLEITIDFFPNTRESISFTEALALGVLLKKVNARRVFEFGTNRGISTAQLAFNVTGDGKVFTLDLPKEDRQTKFDLKTVAEKQLAYQHEKADLIPDHLRERVVLLEQDSATFDESPFKGTMDAVFVDGAHVYEYVRNDSEKGWRMLRPGGVIFWHDFRPQNPDVMRYLFESNLNACRIEATTLAFAVKPLS